MKIEENKFNKGAVCERILRSLPDWFGIESAIVDYIRDVESMPMLVAKEGDQIVGFVSLKIHFSKSAEVYVMGVLSEYHRQKVGRDLILAAEKYLIEKSFEFLTVKTLSESRSDENYDRTRKFYLAMGFIPIEEFKTLWGEHNPCLLLVKSLEFNDPKRV